MKQWALAYAKKGLAVFPLRPKGKQPLTQNGCKDASIDLKQINAWWDKHPDANIGIATGYISGGLFAIDLDVDEDKGINGYETLKHWERENGTFPDSWLSITGRGGYHFLYWSLEHVGNRVNILEGIDIRGEGGYIVAPPSIHPNGKRYEWEQSPEEFPLMEAPDIILEFLNQKEEYQSFKSLIVIMDGERNSTLFKLASSLQAKGLDEESILAAVMKENEKKCQPPLSDKEIQTLVKSAFRYQSGTSSYHAVPDKGGFRVKREPPKLAVKSLAGIEEKDTEWIWPYRIPKGKITMFQGAPGSSKTTLICKIIACITTGEPFIGEDENPFEKRKPLNVLYQITEDDFADTIVKRLRIAGADMTRIFNIDESEQPLTFNDPRLKQAIIEWNIDVVVFDPLVSYIGADTQMNMGNSARAIMNPLINLGQETGCTIIIAAHTSKMSSAEAINRLVGSIDFIGSARSVLTVGRNPNNEKQKALAHTKSNLAALESTILYHIDYEDGLIVFDGYSELTDDEVIAPKQPKSKPSFALDEAKDFLLDFLKDGYATTKEVHEAAEDAGIKKQTLNRARMDLKVNCKQYGGGKNGSYWWVMPGREVPERLRQSQEKENQS